MVVLRSRGEIVGQTETVQLHVQFYGFDGQLTDLSSFPSVTLVQPSGNVILGPTKIGVYHLSTGVYGYDYAVGINGNLGVYTDIWEGDLDGYTITQTLNWVVLNTQVPAINSDGYLHLGDDPGFHFSQVAISNINDLLKALKVRLNSAGKVKGKDEFGNDIFVDCDIYSLDTLVSFLVISLSEFNQIPHFTQFTFDDSEIIDLFFEILVQGATLYALSSKALIERGREFSITDQGVSFVPPTISELMTTQWQAELSNYFEKLKIIKANMKPSPSGLGTFTISSARNPAVARLRMLRARQII